MLNVSRKLSQDFIYVRIDFYILENQLKFGEVTFTPGGDLYKYNKNWSYEDDKNLGNLLEVSEVIA